MEDRNDTQTSESREERRPTLVRSNSFQPRKPDLSCDPDGPVKSEETEERFSSNTSSCSQEQTTSSSMTSSSSSSSS
ncbi:hypothetical protein F2P79_024247, partial [Pimephales promelas]